MKTMARSGGLILVYMTAPDLRTARALARRLVEERLAACVNISGEIESTYRWKGKIEHGREVALVAKTRRALLARLTQRVRALHPYETPCVVAYPIVGGHSAFLAWLRAETTD